MIFARCLDMFWLIEPNFADAAGNLHFSFGILAYITVPVAVISLLVWFYFSQLKKRPLIKINDPHLEEMLEPEHAHCMSHDMGSARPEAADYNRAGSPGL